MPEITSSFEGTVEYTTIPEDTYEAHIDLVEKNFIINPEGEVIITAAEDKSKNPMVFLILQIDSGEYAGRKLSKYAAMVMLGGITREGKPMPLYNLVSLLESSNIPYRCAVNNCDLTGKKIYRGTGKDGKKAGVLYCPECGFGPISLIYNVDDFQGRRMKIAVGIEKDNKGNDVNKVKRFLSL